MFFQALMVMEQISMESNVLTVSWVKTIDCKLNYFHVCILNGALTVSIVKFILFQ